MSTLHFRWSLSRARDTAGQNVLTLLVDGVKVASCKGGGYDMRGTVLGDWLETAYQDRLVRTFADWPTLPYGMTLERTHHELDESVLALPRASLDGACGWASIMAIAERIGLDLSKLSVATKSDDEVWIVKDLNDLKDGSKV